MHIKLANSVVTNLFSFDEVKIFYVSVSIDVNSSNYIK